MGNPSPNAQERPVFLYFGPHPVHERMAERVNAEFVACEQGGAMDRVRAALGREFGKRPVLVEGGVPLLETGVFGLLDSAGPVIELAADATHIDMATPLTGRPAHERLAHRFGELGVDATIAVSDYIAAYARRYDRPVRVSHPFVEGEKYDRLHALDPGGDGETLLCVGKHRHKNGQDILRTAMGHTDGYTAHFVGPDTESIADTDSVRGHGFVELPELYDLFDRADAMVYPARVGAYPVAVLEALVAGTPVLTTPFVGNADLARSVHPEYVVEPDPSAVTAGIEWLADRDLVRDGERARAVGEGFEPEPHLRAFEKRFNAVVSELQGRE